MFSQLTEAIDFHGKALVVRAERQRVIASNIANADTPGYAARDLNFKDNMTRALGQDAALPAAQGTTNQRHIPLATRDGELGAASRLGYTVQAQPAMDNNSVDLNHERGNFVDNAVRYESTLRFINSHAKTILSAIQGQ